MSIYTLEGAITMLERIHESVRAREYQDKKVIFSGVQHIDMSNALTALREELHRQRGKERAERFKVFLALVQREGFQTQPATAHQLFERFEQYEAARQ